MSLLSSVANNILLPLLGVQGSSSSNSQAARSASVSPPPVNDTGQLSPFAKILGALQQLQQADPGKYQQVTQQIAANLQSAAQDAQAGGNTSSAAQLNQLATDFKSASQSGQLPNVQDLAQAVSGGHHGHHHHQQEIPPAQNGDASTSQTINQFLAALDSNATQNSATNAGSIIVNTLASAGISGFSS